MNFRHLVCLSAIVTLSILAGESNAQSIGLLGKSSTSSSFNHNHNPNGLGSLGGVLFKKRASSSAEILALRMDELDTSIDDDCNEFVPLDGLMHMAASGIMHLGFQYLYEEKFGLGKNLSAVLAAGSTFSVGLAKEFIDQGQDFNCFSSADLFMNSMGIISGLTIVYAF